jgi:hypothetical protein
MKTKGLTEGLVIATLVLAVVLSVGTVGAEDVTIGVLYPFSGDLGAYGKPESGERGKRKRRCTWWKT